MNKRFVSTGRRGAARVPALALSLVFSLALAVALGLAACGGGGGGTNPNVAAVTSSSAGVPMYGQPLLITLNGRNLDKPVSVSAAGCQGLALSSTAPHISTPATAYYQCTPLAVATLSFTAVRESDSVTLADLPFTVPQPQVSLTVSNGAGVAGELLLTLDPAKTPLTVGNFLAYVRSGFFIDTVFHRHVPGFIIQGGGFAQPLVSGGVQPTAKATNAPITLEDNAGLLNQRGTIAMARTNAFNSATSQFFFNLADNTNLDRTATGRGYAVFGSIGAGVDVLTAMTAAPCAPWLDFFGAADVGACLPSPNLVVTAAAQTR